MDCAYVSNKVNKRPGYGHIGVRDPERAKKNNKE